MQNHMEKLTSDFAIAVASQNFCSEQIHGRISRLYRATHVEAHHFPKTGEKLDSNGWCEAVTLVVS